MPFPTDPIRAEEARRKMREAQAKRWERPEEREKARQSALRQFADPTVRQKMSETKRNYFALPESRQRIRDTMRKYYETHPEKRSLIAIRMRESRKLRKENHEARIAVARSTEEMRTRRLALIKQRILERT